jgi:hypothetical protein
MRKQRANVLHLLLAVCLAVSMLSFSGAAQDSPPPRPEEWFLTHVTVIDVRTGNEQPESTIRFQQDRIREISSGSHKLPPIAKEVDGRGAFVIPGLWDMHAHALIEDPPKTYFRMIIANGVTGFRDMGGPYSGKRVAELRQQIADGKLLAPRFIAAGPIVDGPKPTWPFSIAVTTTDDARAAVDKVVSDGFDFVKVYDDIPRDAYFALAAEAKQKKFAFAGHLPMAVTPLEASNAGQKSLEHLNLIAAGCSPRETELLARLAKADAEHNRAEENALWELMISTYDETKAAQLFAAFVRNQTWQVPTLVVLHQFSRYRDSALQNDPRMKYVTPEWKKMWDPASDFRFKDYTENDWQYLKKVVDFRSSKLTREMHSAHVAFLAGTDIPNPYTFAGFSLHDEIDLLVKAGFSNLEALQTATLNPAIFLDRQGDLGTVESGKFADLVLLGADPLKEISNTRNIQAVVVSGRYLDRAALDKLLAEAEAAAK